MTRRWSGQRGGSPGSASRSFPPLGLRRYSSIDGLRPYNASAKLLSFVYSLPRMLSNPSNAVRVLVDGRTADPPSLDSYAAECFDNSALSGPALLTRSDDVIDFDPRCPQRETRSIR